jgi:hypothetical protein
LFVLLGSLSREGHLGCPFDRQLSLLNQLRAQASPTQSHSLGNGEFEAAAFKPDCSTQGPTFTGLLLDGKYEYAALRYLSAENSARPKRPPLLDL